MDANQKSNQKPSVAVVIAGALIVVATLAALCYMLNPPAQNTEGMPVAIVAIDGKEYTRITLDPEAPAQTISLEDQGKPITLEVKEGKIRFLHSDCPDQICVNTGFIYLDGQTAICMPNRTAVTVTIE